VVHGAWYCLPWQQTSRCVGQRLSVHECFHVVSTNGPGALRCSVLCACDGLNDVTLLAVFLPRLHLPRSLFTLTCAFFRAHLLHITFSGFYFIFAHFICVPFTLFLFFFTLFLFCRHILADARCGLNADSTLITAGTEGDGGNQQQPHKVQRHDRVLDVGALFRLSSRS
jgi:hypothetical protein